MKLTRLRKYFYDAENKIRECTMCRVVLPFHEFCQATKGRGGQSSRCRKCLNEWQKKNRVKKPRKYFFDVKSKIRECSNCREIKPFSSFHSKKKCPGGVDSTCKKCCTEYRRQKAYGLTDSQYQEMFKIQNGMCAICKNDLEEVRSAVDHCHKTGNVRGLLCSNCNRGIGFLKDSIPILESAIEYLKK